ncbi:MAG TPA: SRPBCC family protein [Candidatus Limnocylindrales bacterium]|nr:SRPBCC family protein [Candidatus Limnocylindrales bacterium]
MGRVTAAIDLPFPADRIWRVATRVEDMPRWLPEVVEAELLDPGLREGSRIRIRLGPGTGNAEITGTVAVCDEPERLEIAGSGGPLGVRVRTVLVRAGAGSTRVSLELEITTPPFLGFIAKEAERRIDAELPASLERFRALMEAEPA